LPVRALTEVDGINVPSFDFELTGSLKINGDVELNGNLTHNGNTTQEGSTTVSEKITTKDLLASGTSEFKEGTTIQGKPFLKHSHSGVQTGNGSTGGVS
jgi:cytoskeletal protein CcmA (bactofilin family)